MRTRSMRAKETREEPSQTVRDFEKQEEDRKAREVRMIHRRLGMDIRFRSTEDINDMLETGRLGGKPVKFFIISAHGTISRKRVFRMPPHMAAFDLAENEYRGHSTCSCLEQPMLDTMIGRNGTNRGSFFNAMLGGEYTPDPTSPFIPQIAYRTPGELAFDIKLDIVSEPEGFQNALGCWDITDAIPTFNPNDFSRRRSSGIYINPNRCRQILDPGARPYWPEVYIRCTMRRWWGTYLSSVIQKLESKYPDTVCFVIVSSCADLYSPELPNAEYPEQPAAYTHYALKGEAVGEPAADPAQSMACRELGDYPIDYGANSSFSMVLRSSTTECIEHCDEPEFI